MRIIELHQTRALASTVDGQHDYRLPTTMWALISIECRGVKLRRLVEPEVRWGTGQPVAYWPGDDPDNVPYVSLFPAPLGNGCNDIEVTYEIEPPKVEEFVK